MAQHQNPCEICERIEQVERGEHPGFIMETATGIAVLGDSQFFRGYSLLLCKTPATELHELPPDIKTRYLEEMSLLAQAVYNVTNCYKINYEMLGNQVHHLHFHIFPRYANEENILKPVWLFQPQGEEAERYKLNVERDAPLVEELRAELSRLLNEPEA